MTARGILSGLRLTIENSMKTEEAQRERWEGREDEEVKTERREMATGSKTLLLYLMAVFFMTSTLFAPADGASESRLSPRSYHTVYDAASQPAGNFMGIENKFDGSGSQDNWIVVGIILGIFCVILLVSLLIRWMWRRVGHSGAGHAAVPEIVPVPPPAQGLELTAIGTLPVIAYPPPPRQPGEVPDSNCPICLEDFSVGVDIRVLPCHHYYHPTCIEAALLSQSRCPYCSQTVRVVDA